MDIPDFRTHLLTAVLTGRISPNAWIPLVQPCNAEPPIFCRSNLPPLFKPWNFTLPLWSTQNWNWTSKVHIPKLQMKPLSGSKPLYCCPESIFVISVCNLKSRRCQENLTVCEWLDSWCRVLLIPLSLIDRVLLYLLSRGRGLYLLIRVQLAPSEPSLNLNPGSCYLEVQRKRELLSQLNSLLSTSKARSDGTLMSLCHVSSSPQHMC